MAGDFVNKPSDCAREAQLRDPTHVSPVGSSTCPSGLSCTRHLQLCFFSASTYSSRRALHPSRPSSTPSRNPPPCRPGFPWGSLGSFGPLGPQKSCPGRLAKLCFWLSVQPALLGRYALRASGGPDAVPRVEFRLPCTGRPTLQRPGRHPSTRPSRCWRRCTGPQKRQGACCCVREWE